MGSTRAPADRLHGALGPDDNDNHANYQFDQQFDHIHLVHDVEHFDDDKYVDDHEHVDHVQHVDDINNSPHDDDHI